jgi:hypothetical protein
MNENINNLILVLITVLSVYGLLEIYYQKKIQYPLSKNQNIIISPYGKQPTHDEIINPLKDYDRRALSDKLTPPLKRDEYNLPVVPISTRGYPERYKRMGILTDPNADNNDKFKFLVLIGRSKYPNSTEYQYYVTDNKGDSTIKFDLKNIKKELVTGDTVTISQLDKIYNVEIDDNLGYEYDPYLV